MGLLDWWKSSRGDCPRCGQKLQPLILSEVQGACGEVTATFLGLPCLSCHLADHPKVFPYAEFSERLHEALFDAGELPMARLARGEFLVCSGCGATAKETAYDAGSVEAELSAERAATFRIKISGPVLQCRSCALKQLAASQEVRGRVVAAIATAFQSVGLSDSRAASMKRKRP